MKIAAGAAAGLEYLHDKPWRSWPKILAGAGFTSTLNGANAKSTFARWP